MADVPFPSRQGQSWRLKRSCPLGRGVAAESSSTNLAIFDESSLTAVSMPPSRTVASSQRSITLAVLHIPLPFMFIVRE